MPKLVYEYVIFYSDDVAQLPIAYPSVKELSRITGLSTQILHKRFNDSDVIYVGEYGIERFKKEIGGL